MSELLINGVAVIFEGLGRLEWQRSAVDRWSLTGVWPSTERQQALLESIRSGGHTLIVLASGDASCTLFEEELAESFEKAVAAEGGIDVTPDLDAGLVDVRIEQLSWLPDEYRASGLLFADWARQQVTTVPALSLPGLMVDDQKCRNLRFAYPTKPVTREHAELLEPFIERVFQKDG
ncbi:hypothetical protein REH65_32530 [Saccharopolyspora sp. ID03-671]|uniref:hypothetical protein n=1 Tax=Saccharopolyspora sp. ID03-671 TaxID=3073066 RepID=UPI003255BE89